jgi:hypothetical protein
MDQAKQNEFFSILNQVADIPRPRLDYSTLSNATLAGCEFIRRLMEIQGFFMAHHRVTGKVPVNRKDLEHLLVLSMNLTPLRLAAIYNACSDAALVSLLADLEVEELFLGVEIERRLADKRIGTVMILAPFFEGSNPIDKWQWLTKELGADKIKYRGRDRAKENHDLRVDLVMRALKKAATLEAPSYEPGPLPPFPLDLHPAERSFWNTGLAKVWRRGHKTLRKGLITILNGDAEDISRSAANYPGDEGKKARRRWEMLHGIKRSPVDKSEAWRTKWDISELAAKEPIHPDTETINAEVNARISTPHEYLLRNEYENGEMKDASLAYEYAERRWGKEGRAFLDTLSQEKGTVTDAARAAGRSRKTAHKRLKELRKHLSKK